MKMLKEKGLTFDDVTLVPQFSEIKSRKDPNVGRYSIFKNGIEYKLGLPIIASPMNTVCETEMATKLLSMGADGIIHRYMSIGQQMTMLYKVYEMVKGKDLPFFAVGATGDFIERTQELYKAGARKFCIDVANGDSTSSIEAIFEIKKTFPDSLLMAGNVCTGEGFKRLAAVGADLIRVGVGSGAMCKTRIVSGNGVPQLTALMWASSAQEQYPNVKIVADGGIRTSGDLVKALVFADYVMLGSLLAATDEAPGEIITERDPEVFNGPARQYKLYAGMASEHGRSLNSWFDREKTAFVPEGESVRLRCKGPVETIINNLIGGLRVGMSYVGAKDLCELKEKAVLMEISEASKIEGTPFGKCI